jgi:hypothetical protein
LSSAVQGLLVLFTFFVSYIPHCMFGSIHGRLGVGIGVGRKIPEATENTSTKDGYLLDV